MLWFHDLQLVNDRYTVLFHHTTCFKGVSIAQRSTRQAGQSFAQDWSNLCWGRFNNVEVDSINTIKLQYYSIYLTECKTNEQLLFPAMMSLLVLQEYAERMSSHSGYYGTSNLARSSSTPIVIPRYDESTADTSGDASSFSRSSKLNLFKKELNEAR